MLPGTVLALLLSGPALARTLLGMVAYPYSDSSQPAAATPTPVPTAAATQTPIPTPTPDASGATSNLRTITHCDTRLRDSVQLGADLVASKDTSCLVVRASGITIEGNGHHISAPGAFAVQWNDQSDVTVRNIVSEQGIQIYGTGANRNVVEKSKVGTIGIFMGDDNVVQDSTVTALRARGMYDDPSLRTVFRRNTVEGSGWSSIMVYLSPSDGQSTCIRSDTVVEDNYIHSTVEDPNAADQVLLYLRCGSFNTIVGNTMIADGKARGIYMRDEADDNLIQDNLVRVNQGDRSAFHISSGNTDKHHPRNNTVDHNVFRADATRSIYIQSSDFRNNVFTRNLFWSNFAEGARIAGGTDNVFDHNTFVNRAGQLLVLEAFQPPGNSYTNNVFVYSGKDASAPVFNLSGQYDLGGYHGDNNVYFNHLGPVVFDDGGGDLDYWRGLSGADASSIVADPLFVAESAGDFELEPDSPASTSSADGGASGAFAVDDVGP